MTAVLGVYTGHDPGACLLIDGAVAGNVEEERLTRFKHGLPKDARDLWGRFGGRFGYVPWSSIAEVLAIEGLGLDDLDAIVLPEDALACDMAGMFPVRDRSKILVSHEPRGGAHHHRHALSAFLASPFERAAVLVIDGDGTVSAEGYEAESAYLFESRAQFPGREVWKNRYPSGAALRGGLGWAYEYVSAILGFVATAVGYLGEPGKTMGLAPFGGPSPELAGPWFIRDGVRLDFAPFHAWLQASGNTKRLRFDSRERALIQDEAAIPQAAKDLAWKVQHELEDALLGLVAELHRRTGVDALCLAGGVALNSVANGRIVREGPFSRVFIQPAAHDGGQALGLAYEGHLRVLAARPQAEGDDEPRARTTPPMEHAFGGRTYLESATRALLLQSGLGFEAFPDDLALAEDAAAELERGRIVGWHQGGSEVGPRALGHRSILADPRDGAMKDRLNARVKFREGFRPFAPAVPRERAGEVFELEGESPYMLLVVPVREAWRAKVPAITHVDGTARVQTVDRAVDPRFHALLEAFGRRTGVPVVLNTSFNLRGMPIVETPREALTCFLYTDLDALYVGRLKVTRPDLGRLVPCAAPGWRLVAETTIGWGGQSVRARYEREHGEPRPVEVRPSPVLVTLCTLFDGQRTLADALQIALDGERPAADLIAACAGFVQSLLRQGALRLRVGELEL